MTRDEMRQYKFNWIDDDALIERICDRVCVDCPAWHYDHSVGQVYCPVEDPTLTSCVRWYEVDSYLETMIQADGMLTRVFGGRHD